MCLHHLILAPVMAVLCVIQPGGGPAAASSAGRQETGFLTPPAIEERLLEALNQERARNGRPPVRPLSALADVARDHSRKMAGAARLFHASETEKPLNDRLVAAGLFFSKAGENVARADSFLPALIHQALLGSPPHRENMLDPDFDAAGIGVVSVDDLNYYVSQVFLRSIRVLDKNEAAAELKRQANETRRAAGLPPLVFWEEADWFAGTMLLSRSHGAPVPEPPAKLGSVRGFFSESPQLGFEKEAAAGIVDPSRTHAGLALDFRRTAANPGGAYLLALILMSENALNRPEADLVGAVLAAVNATRRARELKELVLGQARSATPAVKDLHGEARTTFPLEAGTRALAYMTFNPADIPAEIKREILAPGLRFIGIQALFQQTEEYPLGVIRVVLFLRSS